MKSSSSTCSGGFNLHRRTRIEARCKQSYPITSEQRFASGCVISPRAERARREKIASFA